MEFKTLAKCLVISNLIGAFNAPAAELLKYKIQDKDQIGIVLNQLGVCPIWGTHGNVTKVIHANPGINPRKLVKDSWLTLPLDSLPPAKHYEIKDGEIKILNRDVELCVLKNTNVEQISVVDLVFPPPAKYKTGDELVFKVVYSEEVFVQFGTPRLKIRLGPKVTYAQYKDGSGSNQLTFVRKVTERDRLTDTDKLQAVSISEENSNIEGQGRKYVEHEFNMKEVGGLKVNPNAPKVVDIIPPDEAKYALGDKLPFLVSFTRNVQVVGHPALTLINPEDPESSKLKAAYLSGAGTKELTFEFKIAEGQSYKRMQIDGNFDFREGEIRDDNNKAIASTFLSKEFNISVDTSSPKLKEIIYPEGKSYQLGDSIEYRLKFNEKIEVVGTPKIKVNLEQGEGWAVFEKQANPKELVFKYTIGLHQYESTGLRLGEELIDGEITDSAGNPFKDKIITEAKGIRVDTNPPIIVRVDGPQNNFYSQNEVIEFKVAFNEPVRIIGHPKLRIMLGEKKGFAKFNGLRDDRTASFVYTVRPKEKLLAGGITVTNEIDLGTRSRIVDTSDTPLLPAEYYEKKYDVILDGNIPVVANAYVIGKKKFKAGDKLHVALKFSEDVIVEGTPEISIKSGEENRTAKFVGMKNKNVLLFEDVIPKGISAKNLSVISPIVVHEGHILNSDGSKAHLRFNDINLTNVKIDSIHPIVTKIHYPEKKKFKSGDVINLRMEFSEKVKVDQKLKLETSLGNGNDFIYRTAISEKEILLRYFVKEDIHSPQGSLTFVNVMNSLGGIEDSLGNKLIDVPIFDHHLIEIDSRIPKAIDVVASGPQILRYGDELKLLLSFNREVIVEGVPALRVKFASGPVLAKYTAGSGTNTLEFSYKIKEKDFTKDSATIGRYLRLAAASIKDNLGNTFDGKLNQPKVIQVTIDGSTPLISRVIMPPPKTYRIGERLDFKFQYDSEISLDGVVELKFRIGNQERSIAGKAMDDNKKRLVFSYNISEGDAGKGVSLITPLTVTNGSVVNSIGTNASLNFRPISRSLVVIDGEKPVLAKIDSPQEAIYYQGNILPITLHFSEPINWPKAQRLKTSIPGTSLEYKSGNKTNKIKLNYIVQENTESLIEPVKLIWPQELVEGITDISGNGLKLSGGETSIGNVFVDGIAPHALDVEIAKSGIYKAGDEISFKLTLNEVVDVSEKSEIILKLASGEFKAKYVSGTGTSELHYAYQLTELDHDEDGIHPGTDLDLSISGIKDRAGNKVKKVVGIDKVLDVLIIGNEAVIASIDPVRRGIFKHGDYLDLDVRFNKDIVLNGLRPKLNLEIAKKRVVANYLSQIRPDTIRVRYKVESKVNSNDGVVALSPLIVEGEIKDVFGVKAITSFAPFTLKDIIVDTGAPKIKKIELPPGGEFNSGEELRFKVIFSEDVIVDSIPELVLNLKSGMVTARYLAGSGTSDLYFIYRVQDGDFEQNSVVIESPVRFYDNGSIKDAAGNNAIVTFPNIQTDEIKIVGSTPQVVAMTGPKNETYGPHEEITFNVEFSGNVKVVGEPQLMLDIGGKTRYAKCVKEAGENHLMFSYKIQENDFDSDGIKVISPFNFNNGSIRSIHGLLVKKKFEQPDTRKVMVDTRIPKVIGIKTLVSKYLKANDKFSFALQFSEPVYVRGSPQVAVKLPGRIAFAEYKEGNGSEELKFEYVIQKDDVSNEGIEITSPVLVDGASIVDEDKNKADALFTSFKAQDVVIDSIAPHIQSITIADARTYEYGDDVVIKVLTSEPVLVHGQPRIPITLKSGTYYANYLYGSGTRELIFNYRVRLGDLDSDGIELEEPLDLRDGDVFDFSKNDLKTSFIKYLMADVKVDGQDTLHLSRKMANSPNTIIGGGNQYDLMGSSPFSNFEFQSQLTSVRLESVEHEDNTKAHLTSATNLAVGGKWYTKWDQDWESYIGANIKRIVFEEATNRNVENTNNVYTKLSLGLNHYYMENLKLIGEFSIDKRPYIYSKDTTTLVIDPIGIYKISAGGAYAVKRFGPYQLGLSAMGDVLLPKKSDNLSLQTGYGLSTLAFVRQDIKKGYIKAEAFYEMAAQESDISAQNYTELGFGISLNCPLEGL